MATTFELFRLSLLPSRQIDMFDRTQARVTRESWLRTIFSEQSQFATRSAEYAYVSAAIGRDDKILLGRFGRHLFRDENKPPSEGLVEFVNDSWLACLVLVDTSEQTDGQKVAVQVSADIGSPSALIKAFCEQVNQDHRNRPYSIEVSQIIEPASFWKFVSKNEGRVTSITFEFIAPNMFDTEDEFLEDMRNFRDSERARKVSFGLSNPEGLQARTRKIEQAVQYAEKGGGTIRARAVGNRRYNSNDKVKKTVLDDLQETGSKLVESARQLAQRILGRE